MKKILLVTGGGRGIGAATAVLAAERGWAVAVGYSKDEASAHAVVRNIVDHGGQAMAVQADVGQPDQVLRMFEHIDQHWGPVSGLVNNAGVVDVAARLDEMDWARWRRMFDINVLGSFLCAREAVRRMSTRHGGQGGAIVNMSSVAARLGAPGQYVDYACAKAAVDTLTLGLAREVAAEGIRVNAVRPGIIDTEIHASGGQPTRAQDMAPQIPMQRPGTADEVAQAVLWLLSAQSSYTTGTIIDVAGGR